MEIGDGQGYLSPGAEWLEEIYGTSEYLRMFRYSPYRSGFFDILEDPDSINIRHAAYWPNPHPEHKIK